MAMRGPREPQYEHDPEDEDGSAWSELGKFLLLVAFVTLVFLLGRSMVHHHFFTGGGQNNQNTGGPTGP
jgi:hypothetical protein